MIFLPPLLSLKGEFILTSWGLVKCGGVSVSCYTSSGNNQYINQSNSHLNHVAMKGGLNPLKKSANSNSLMMM